MWRLPIRLSALFLLALPDPAQAQNEPFRIVNAAALPAVALHLARSGAEDWGRNLLNQGPVRPGAFFAMRMPEGAGCRFDIRLVLQDGQEVIRRDADVCAERLQTMAPGMPAAPPRAEAPLPQVGGGDRLLPTVGGARP
ncbi:hypothetical protein J5Y09_15160 [Roseomonas sp. PWR1]|uniref:Uncharacterized protein n=1 Tax=Roseomonas nitratireducens TaxID=2820810 RepID=A0ABS4AV67_9PROT|nr:hypothetical protein [Neoroseomonas nitratireducens]MBP0465263.1 hypothetical protein [Neoroseomonas nitratireducens]